MVIILKPTYACNFRCKYCYLSNNTKVHTNMFDINFAKHVVLQIKNALIETPQRNLTFIWHGGEPLLWGKSNYQEILEFMQSQLSGFNLHNSIQTNLSLIDDEYLDILSHYNVRIGFSLDGPKEIHDYLRLDINEAPTYDIIMSKLALCRKRGLNPGCIVVGSRIHIGRIRELYDFMTEQKLGFKFNPLFISGEAKKNFDEYSISPQEYAQMCIELFDLWFNDYKGEVKESNFVEIASNIATGHTAGCIFSCNCQNNFMAITPSGDVMPCGRFCDDSLREFAHGNLYSESLVDILPRIKQSEVFSRAEYIANSDCSKCKWYNICHGGCPHDGLLNYGNINSKTVLCSAYKLIFNHIEKEIHKVGII